MTGKDEEINLDAKSEQPDILAAVSAQYGWRRFGQMDQFVMQEIAQLTPAGIGESSPVSHQSS